MNTGSFRYGPVATTYGANPTDSYYGLTSGTGGGTIVPLSLTVKGSLTVDGATTLNSSLDVSGAITAHSSLDVTGAITAHSTLDVSGGITTAGDLRVYGGTILDTLGINNTGLVTYPLQVAGSISANGILCSSVTMTGGTLTTPFSGTVGSPLLGSPYYNLILQPGGYGPATISNIAGIVEIGLYQGADPGTFYGGFLLDQTKFSVNSICIATVQNVFPLSGPVPSSSTISPVQTYIRFIAPSTLGISFISNSTGWTGSVGMTIQYLIINPL